MLNQNILEMKKSNTSTNLQKIKDFPKQERVPLMPIKWLSFHPNGDVYATFALGNLIERYYHENW